MEKTDFDVKQMLDYLAHKERSNMFEGNFKNRVKVFYDSLTHRTQIHASVIAYQLWETYTKKGIVGTFQEFIQDKEAVDALVFALNS